MKYLPHYVNRYAAQTPEDLGAELFLEDKATASVLTEERDELRLEVGDYLDEVIGYLDEADPERDTAFRERIFDGYRKARDAE